MPLPGHEPGHLELAGVVAKRRTAGTYVSEAGAALARDERRGLLAPRADALLAEARQLDLALEEVLDLLRERDAARRAGEREEVIS